ncbi:hypothetical protein GCM10010353_60690 [Streptomyces chryseus]|uniref:Uncharacterized protein n=1 Tax=Streptomyces chryseus TaxID=68186 RepID=A0ABQ3E4Q1_9ACTN|nr:hypothetical protein GCM10010353_60690 [Streptomyces chryseus]GHB25871.1 hypothetical protein GCM10010346_56820 [Streptomyces chryseus]
MQARTAHLVALHQDDFLAEGRGAQGGAVTAGAPTDHDDIDFMDFRHEHNPATHPYHESKAMFL